MSQRCAGFFPAALDSAGNMRRIYVGQVKPRLSARVSLEPERRLNGGGP